MVEIGPHPKRLVCWVKSASLGGQSASFGGQSASFGGQSASLGGQSASLGGQKKHLLKTPIFWKSTHLPAYTKPQISTLLGTTEEKNKQTERKTFFIVK